MFSKFISFIVNRSTAALRSIIRKKTFSLKELKTFHLSSLFEHACVAMREPQDWRAARHQEEEGLKKKKDDDDEEVQEVDDEKKYKNSERQKKYPRYLKETVIPNGNQQHKVFIIPIFSFYFLFYNVL